MTIDSQIQRTSGTIIGELMRDSEITFPHGKYIIGINLASQLLDNGIKISGPKSHREILLSFSYGDRDNIWTRVQALTYYHQENRSRLHEYFKYSYNPWTEIMGGMTFDQISNMWYYKNLGVGEGPLEIVVDNPREGVERLKVLYKLFIELDKSYQNDFLGEVDTYSCTLYYEMNSTGTFKRWKNHPMRSLLNHKMMRGLSKEDKRKLQYVLDLLAAHSICVAKGKIVRSEIEDLMGYDTSTIPTHWEEGTLDDAVIQERVAELNDMLEEKALSR